MPPGKVPVPTDAALSTKVTVPVRVPAPSATALTIAVSVTGCPRADGFLEEVTAVELADFTDLAGIVPEVADVAPVPAVDSRKAMRCDSERTRRAACRPRTYRYCGTTGNTDAAVLEVYRAGRNGTAGQRCGKYYAGAVDAGVGVTGQRQSWAGQGGKRDCYGTTATSGSGSTAITANEFIASIWQLSTAAAVTGRLTTGTPARYQPPVPPASA